MIKRVKIVLLAGLISSVGLTACLSVLPDPEPSSSIYRLNSENSIVEPTSDARVFRIDRPTAPRNLLGSDIIVSPDGNRMIKVAQAQWTENVPELIQHSFMDVLSARSDLIGILPTSGARSEYRVHLTVKQFEAVFDNGEQSAPEVAVHYIATVADASSRDLIGTREVRETRRAGSTNVNAIVAAQGEANKAVLNEIADWMASLNVE